MDTKSRTKFEYSVAKIRIKDKQESLTYLANKSIRAKETRHDINNFLTMMLMSENSEKILVLKDNIHEYQNTNAPDSKQWVLAKTLINHAIAICSPIVLKNRFLLDKKVEGDFYIYTNQKVFNNIVLNLIKNAVEAPNKNPQRTICIKSYMDPIKESFIMKIQDNGIGIKKEHINKIFEKGFTTKQKNKGSRGYGLFLVEESLRNILSGRVEVISNHEAGTTFTIELKEPIIVI